jgi:exodeoxyribonuclease VII small subunit
MPTAATEITALSYEMAFAELDAIVSALEGDEQPLEQALALFARGQLLARHCADLLEQAELTIQQVSAAGLSAFELSE